MHEEGRDGQVIVVTGGSSGIGRAAARRFVREGASVVLFARSDTDLAAACAELGPAASAVVGDVACLADLDHLAAEVRARHGGVDHLFVNAGIAEWALAADVSADQFDRLFTVNVRGAFFTVQKLLPLLRSGGSIVFNTSIANAVGLSRTGVYAATKSALGSFTRTLAAELIGRGLRVNAVSPGPTETPIQAKSAASLTPEALSEMQQALVPRLPLRRLAQPNEIAAVVAFLASPAASFILGQELTVDGGLTAL